MQWQVLDYCDEMAHDKVNNICYQHGRLNFASSNLKFNPCPCKTDYIEHTFRLIALDHHIGPQ